VTRGLAVLLAAVALGATACGSRPRISVEVDGTTERIAAGSTLAEAVERLGLRPRAGNLVDIQGAVLRRRAYPGRLLLNGRSAEASTTLREGDRIVLVSGRDRRERLVREVLPVRGGIPSNPQAWVSRTAGVKIVTRGAISHKLVSTRYRPIDGPAKRAHAVALTFDDGPSPTYTPQVLDVLRRMHVRATFFVIGFLVDAYPQLVKREHALGMAVGNHTYNHPEVPPFDTLPRRLLDAEIGLGAESLSRVGIFASLLRPPAGSASPSVVRAAEGYGERVVLWSVDPVDWGKGVTAAEIRTRVLDAVHPGSIVDLHDGGGDRSATVAALPGIIRGIRHRHLRLVALPR
jgi:peptidoglycan/xylan/chitin deacetylase (PgdA/CDA1 family)/sulfur carrier protein ThiS